MGVSPLHLFTFIHAGPPKVCLLSSLTDSERLAYRVRRGSVVELIRIAIWRADDEGKSLRGLGLGKDVVLGGKLDEVWRTSNSMAIDVQ